MNNDIALVLLKGRGIPLGKDIMPICLPPENTEYSPGLNCTISGFGSVESGKTGESGLVTLRLINRTDKSDRCFPCSEGSALRLGASAGPVGLPG
jgi:hypothetical protein